MIRGWNTRRVGGALVLLVAAPAVWASAQSDEATVRARQRISMMEGVLERAVTNGADNLVRQVRTLLPDPPMFLGVPKARGFRLDGYGVFFDVEVPGLRPPVTWTLRYMLDDSRRVAAALAELRTLTVQLAPRERERADQVVARIEAQVRAARGGVPVSSTLVSASPAGASDLSGSPPPPAPVDPAVVLDPNEAYTREVRNALVEAMLESSAPLTLGADEWLTVAARDNVAGDPLVPGDKANFATLIFRIKGSDLAALRAGRLTLEQARAKVDQRAY